MLGTSAQRNPDLLGELADGLRGRDRRLGRREGLAGGRRGLGGGDPTTVDDAIRELGGRGVRRFVYTPVEVDGTLEGPGLGGLDPILAACAETGAGADLLGRGRNPG